MKTAAEPKSKPTISASNGALGARDSNQVPPNSRGIFISYLIRTATRQNNRSDPFWWYLLRNKCNSQNNNGQWGFKPLDFGEIRFRDKPVSRWKGQVCLLASLMSPVFWYRGMSYHIARSLVSHTWCSFQFSIFVKLNNVKHARNTSPTCQHPNIIHRCSG